MAAWSQPLLHGMHTSQRTCSWPQMMQQAVQRSPAATHGATDMSALIGKVDRLTSTQEETMAGLQVRHVELHRDRQS